MKLNNLADIKSGQPQFRIVETLELAAPAYTYYSQTDLENDLFQQNNTTENKQVRTFDEISDILAEGDVVFSLVSGKAARVNIFRSGYLFTQNYVKLTPSENLDKDYLVYLLNEHRAIQKQFQLGLQGSQVLKYTVKQLRELQLPPLPTLEKQKAIGRIYFKQLKRQGLQNKVAQLETTLILNQLKGVSNE